MIMFYYLTSLIVIIVILIIFNNIAMKKIRKQQDIIDDMTITIENYELKELSLKDSNNNFKTEYLTLNWNDRKGDKQNAK